MVSKEKLIELQEIIRQEYGLELSMIEVSKIGNGLANFFDLLARIDYAEKYDKET